MTDKTPRVGLTFKKGHQLSVGLGYYVEAEGHKWSYARAEDIGRPPHEVGALLLDPLLLEIESVTDGGVLIYKYRATLQVE